MAKDKPEPEPDRAQLSSIPHERTEQRPDFSEPLPRTSLPKEIQKNLDSDERMWNLITSGHAEDSTESNVRYAAYASRLRTIMLSAHRYVAYTSDIGESFRPVAHPNWVRAAYGVSWAYLIGDVSHEGYKAYLRNQEVRSPKSPAPDAPADVGAALQAPGKVPAIEDYRSVMAQRAVFQGIASMGLPAFTIHSIVRYSGRAMKGVKNPTLRAWGPIGLGLAAVPALPYMFDHPVELATETVFHKAFELIGGPQAVGQSGVNGGKVPEKEL